MDTSDGIIPIENLESLYAWVDEIPLSVKKKNITRDFSDGGKYCIFS